LDGSNINCDTQARLTDAELDKLPLATVGFKDRSLPEIGRKGDGTPRTRASMFNDLDNMRITESSNLGGQSSATGSKLGKVNTGSKIMLDN